MNDYLKSLESLDIRSRGGGGPQVLDLFAGCGGLALGFESVGFETLGYECNSDAAATYNLNLRGECREEFITPDTQFEKVDVVIGGPPCQPFSVGGQQLGLKDSRDGFPAFLAAVKQLQPRIFMIENVRGMMYQNRHYLHEIMEKLRDYGYCVDVKLLKAVELGVPQNRERVVIVGHTGGFQFPHESHVRFTAGDAVGDIAYSVTPDTKFLSTSQDAYIARYEKASKCVNPRDLYLDRPARTLTCRNLAGATGDMHRIRLPDGRRKRVTFREAARLQSFPDWFEYHGTETSIFTQIGNSVPPKMAQNLAISVLSYLNGEVFKSPKGSQLEFIYEHVL